MPCRSCKSENQHRFRTETNLHFPHVVDNGGFEFPNVFIFPKLTICLDCGSAEGELTPKDLQNLKKEFAQAQQKRAQAAN